ncbi:hypothetical protein MANES_16G118000v8 [Manihot esculenta]|uniref:Uncharacterized protein n=1 Tax=Manihot esculenta TaxID=3983 RepID=A0A2C9UAS6_MANES|nr:hypothetical protein MANES_16G118000v8 [Manihot esculenta]
MASIKNRICLFQTKKKALTTLEADDTPVMNSQGQRIVYKIVAGLMLCLVVAVSTLEADDTPVMNIQEKKKIYIN